jgi:2-dehydropantoate 2-reductase
MRLAILGAGALGCVLGGFIAEAGHDVILIGRRKSHIDAMNENGLIITGFRGRHVVKVTATDNPLEVKDAELLILTTKIMDTTDALDSVRHLRKDLGYLKLSGGLPW